MSAGYLISLCHALCQHDRGVFLQKAKLPQKVKGAAPRVSSWASRILFQVFKVLESFDKQILSGLCFSIGCFFTARF